MNAIKTAMDDVDNVDGDSETSDKKDATSDRS